MEMVVIMWQLTQVNSITIKQTPSTDDHEMLLKALGKKASKCTLSCIVKH